MKMLWPKMLLTCAAAAVVHSVDLTTESFAELTAGKTAFLKFYAPWCGHCRALKPAWDALIEEYQTDPHVLIGACDCTAGCQSLCRDMEIQGYPTLRFGDPAALEDYTGPRDAASLSAHAKTLKPPCALDKPELCDDEQMAELEHLLALAPEDLRARVEQAASEFAALEAQHKVAVHELQQEYLKLQAAKTAEERRMARTLALVKVVEARRAQAHEEL